MPFELSEVKSLEDFASVVPVEWKGYSNPPNPFWDILKGPTVEECTQRQWAWHNADPDSNWLKLTDTENGTIVGGVEWVVHKEDPFKKPMPAIEATWWPEGSAIRDMSNRILDKFFSGRVGRMNRPHLLIGYCFVLPSYRRQGLGRMMMEWGTSIADDLGLECFVESTEDGRALYESVGFTVVNAFHVDPHQDNASEEYTKLAKSMFPQPQRGWFMWRPKGGNFIPGETKYSWE